MVRTTKTAEERRALLTELSSRTVGLPDIAWVCGALEGILRRGIPKGDEFARELADDIEVLLLELVELRGESS